MLQWLHGGYSDKAVMMSEQSKQSDVIQRAWNLACELHHGQTMPSSNLPYVKHIGMVSIELALGLLHEPSNDKELGMICAILHDSVEDTAMTLPKITELFGAEVAAGVSALTKDKQLFDKEAQMLDSLQRIKLQPPIIGAVKLADRITNLQAPPSYWDQAKIAYYQQEARLIWQHLHPCHGYLAARLQQKIDDYACYLKDK